MAPVPAAAAAPTPNEEEELLELELLGRSAARSILTKTGKRRALPVLAAIASTSAVLMGFVG